MGWFAKEGKLGGSNGASGGNAGEWWTTPEEFRNRFAPISGAVPPRSLADRGNHRLSGDVRVSEGTTVPETMVSKLP
jgi:hypothetical protein